MMIVVYIWTLLIWNCTFGQDELLPGWYMADLDGMKGYATHLRNASKSPCTRRTEDGAAPLHLLHQKHLASSSS